MTLDDVIGEFIRLALAGGIGLPIMLIIIAVLAVVVVLFRNVSIPKRDPVPDPVESPPSPPITVRPDGSIPVANPEKPDYDPTQG